ncbi:MAG: M48 family metallopeptidase [Bacteroidales bacterium]|nr:M48 family metallopeptidase [Bacteroidales bacterium]
MTSTFFYIIIIILVFNFLLETGLTLLNYFYPQRKFPLFLSKIYSKEKYEKSQAYEQAKLKSGMFISLVQFLVVFAFFYFGGFAYVDSFVRSQSNHYIVQNLLFFGLLAFVSDILMIPVSIYHTFYLEEKFGFNKTSIKTFVLDKLKAWLLMIIIGGGILSLVVFIYELSGSNFWWLTWLTISLISLLFTAFYSEIIVPIFNKQTPLEEGSLRNAIEIFSKKAGFQLDNIYTIDGSKRSTKANAYFSGIGSKKRIVLYDTLIKDLEEEELVAVLAHEIGHYKKKHTIVGIISSIIQTGIMLFILSFFISKDSDIAINLAQAVAGNNEQVSSSFYLGIIGFGLIYSPISLIFGLLSNLISRANEYAADAFAVKYGLAKALGNGLIKLTANNLSKVYPHPLYIFFYYSHPSLLQRINRMNVPEFKD